MFENMLHLIKRRLVLMGTTSLVQVIFLSRMLSPPNPLITKSRSNGLGEENLWGKLKDWREWGRLPCQSNIMHTRQAMTITASLEGVNGGKFVRSGATMIGRQPAPLSGQGLGSAGARFSLHANIDTACVYTQMMTDREKSWPIYQADRTNNIILHRKQKAVVPFQL